MYREKLLSTTERLAHRLPIVPVIIKTKPNKFDTVFNAIKSLYTDFGGLLIKKGLNISLYLYMFITNKLI